MNETSLSVKNYSNLTILVKIGRLKNFTPANAVIRKDAPSDHRKVFLTVIFPAASCCCCATLPPSCVFCILPHIPLSHTSLHTHTHSFPLKLLFLSLAHTHTRYIIISTKCVFVLARIRLNVSCKEEKERLASQSNNRPSDIKVKKFGSRNLVLCQHPPTFFRRLEEMRFFRTPSSSSLQAELILL